MNYNRGDVFTVTGWGHTSYNGVNSDKLQTVDVPYVPDDGK